MPAVRPSIPRSLVARLLAPVAIMLLLVAGVQVLDSAVRARLLAASVASAMVQQGEAGTEIGKGMDTALARVRQVAARMDDLRRVASTTGAVAGTLQNDAAALLEDAGSVDVALRGLVSDHREAA